MNKWENDNDNQLLLTEDQDEFLDYHNVLLEEREILSEEQRLEKAYEWVEDFLKQF